LSNCAGDKHADINDDIDGNNIRDHNYDNHDVHDKDNNNIHSVSHSNYNNHSDGNGF
jgi:hypothetical protein